jgi:dTDP-glucose 4,6-dehydratase
LKILVTGGAGFIGSNFIYFLLKKHPQYKLVNADLLTYAGNLENLKEVLPHKTHRFIRCDICDGKTLKKLFAKEKFDAVVNFAAESHVDRSIMDAAPFIRTNFAGVGVLLDLAMEYGVKRFLQVSTDEVYGSVRHGFFKEDDRLQPSSAYAASKAAAELLVMSYHKTHGLPVLITRSSNNYGPYQFPEKLIPLVIANAMANKKIPVYGDGMNVRDWLYVVDNCRAIDLVLHQGVTGQVYNIGGNNEKHNIDVIRTILERLKKPAKLIQYVQDRPGHDRRYALDTSKIKHNLGFEPEVDFERGIGLTIEWYSKHKEWVARTRSGEYKKFYKKYYSKLGLKTR